MNSEETVRSALKVYAQVVANPGTQDFIKIPFDSLAMLVGWQGVFQGEKGKAYPLILEALVVFEQLIPRVYVWVRDHSGTLPKDLVALFSATTVSPMAVLQYLQENKAIEERGGAFYDVLE